MKLPAARDVARRQRGSALPLSLLRSLTRCAAAQMQMAPPSPPFLFPRTNRTSLVPPLVLIGRRVPHQMQMEAKMYADMYNATGPPKTVSHRCPRAPRAPRAPPPPSVLTGHVSSFPPY